MTVRIACADGRDRERAVAAALAAVRRGDLVLLPTEGAYAVVTDAFSARGTAAMRAAKGAEDDLPLPVLVGRRTTVAGVAIRISDDAQRLMDAFWPGPLTVLLTPQPSLAWDHPHGAPVALRMPLHPVALAVLASAGPLAATSANQAGLAAPLDADDALEQLGEAITVALDAGPAVHGALPSSVVDATGAVPVLLREGALTVADLRRVCPHAITGPDVADA
ncbi:MAG: L-threonylcarbamoyladenylate synthase [Candidatus Nanopelagicales bacterium]